MARKSREFRESRRGFTLIELTAYMTLMVILGAPLVSVVVASTRSTRESDTINRLEERNRTALFRMEQELRKAMSGTLLVLSGGKSLSFTTATGFDGTAVVNGAVVSYVFRPAGGEKWDGVDENQNGLVDESELVRRNLATLEETLISSAIDPAASGFALTGTGATITVGSFGTLHGGGSFSVQRSVTVYPRN